MLAFEDICNQNQSELPRIGIELQSSLQSVGVNTISSESIINIQMGHISNNTTNRQFLEQINELQGNQGVFAAIKALSSRNGSRSNEPPTFTDAILNNDSTDLDGPKFANKLHIRRFMPAQQDGLPNQHALFSIPTSQDVMAVLRFMLKFSFSDQLNQNKDWVDLICNSHGFIAQHIDTAPQQLITMKNILKVISAAIGMKVFKINRKKEELLSMEAAIIMAYMKSKYAENINLDMQQFLVRYPGFGAADVGEEESAKLLEFCNCVRIVQCLIPPHNNKEHILDLASRLTEGASVKRVTGTGMTVETRHRYDIIHKEGRLEIRPRPERHTIAEGNESPRTLSYLLNQSGSNRKVREWEGEHGTDRGEDSGSSDSDRDRDRDSEHAGDDEQHPRKRGRGGASGLQLLLEAGQKF